MDAWDSTSDLLSAGLAARPEVCPDCGGPLAHASGCVTCRICGRSACE